MSGTHYLTRKLRQRRDERELNRVLRTASPAMHQELLALAAHQSGAHR